MFDGGRPDVGAGAKLTGGLLKITLLLLVSAPAVRAAEPARPVNIGVVGGYHLTDGDSDLLGDRSRVQTLQSSGFVGARIGYLVYAPYLGLELTLGLVPLSAEPTGADGYVIPLLVDALVYFTEGVVEPYFAAGVGLNNLVGELGNDTDFVLDVGLGARFRVAELVALRAEVRLFASDAVDRAMSANMVFLAGVDFLVGAASPRSTPEDRDGDGVVNISDQCPEQPGAGDPGGCPDRNDRDGDGLIDARDSCPLTRGGSAFPGCPDSDSDDHPDVVDRCPDEPGPGSSDGCPDTDRDGLIDRQDACPDEEGKPEHHGCPPPGASPRINLLK